MSKKADQITRLDALLRHYGVGPSDWDLVLCGDGSGGGWAIGGAYATFIVDRILPVREFLTGGCSRSTVNRMELSAYVNALSYHYFGLANGRLAHTPYRVWIFTDSEITAKVGEGLYAKKSNIDLWHMVTFFESRGYRLNWRQLSRNSTTFHEAADDVAGRVRTAILAEDYPSDKLMALMPYTEGTTAVVICQQCQTPLQSTSAVCPICQTERVSGGIQEEVEEEEKESEGPNGCN